MGLEELKGHAAIRQGWVDALSAYAAFNLPEGGRTDLGNGVILTVLVVKGLLSDTGGDLNMRYAQVNEWRDGLDRQRNAVHPPRRGPCCRRTPRRRTGVGGVAGELMTPWASPSTDEMGETWR